jgi:hypothetical protein
VFCEWRICWSIILQKRLTKWDKWIFSSFSCFSKFERKCLWSEILYLFLLFECCRTANYRYSLCCRFGDAAGSVSYICSLALCHSLSKRTNIIYKVYYMHFKWRTIFTSVLKNNPINRKMKSITNPSINTTYPLKIFLVKIHFIKFATLALCHSFSKRTNIIYKVYYMHFKWRTIFKSVLKNKPTNRKIKSIMNPSINTTYPLKNFWSKFT